MASPEPHYKKFFRGGRWKKEGTGKKEQDEKHGFDKQGRIRVIDAYHSLLFDYRDDHIEEIRFDHRNCAVYVKHYFFETNPDRFHRSLSLRSNGGIESHYQWSGDRIEKIEARGWTAEDLIFEDETWSGDIYSNDYYDYLFTYDPNDGEIREIKRVSPDPDSDWVEIEYRRKKKGETVKSVAQELEEMLLKRIPERLSDYQSESPVYALFLIYCSSGWECDPQILPASEEMKDNADPELCWFVGGLGVEWLDLGDKQISDRWTMFYQLMTEESNFMASVELLRRVARKLNDADPPVLSNTTQDFIVTSTDSVDGIDVMQDLEACVPPEKLAKLDFSAMDW
jgi:hypothetical protein